MFSRNNENIDFAELEQRVSLEVAKLARRAPSPAGPAAPRGADPELPARIAAPAETATEAAPEPPRSLRRRVATLGWAVRHFPRVLRRAITAVYMAEDARERVAVVERRLDLLAGRHDGLASLAGETTTRLDVQRTVADTLASQTESLSGRTDRLAAKLDVLTPLPERLAALERSHAGQLSALRGEIMFQQRRLTRVSLPAAAPAATAAGEAVTEQRLDSLYAAFEDVFRGAREDIKARLSVYLDRLLIAGAGQRDKPIVDIGCGRGEWLELLKENGLHAYGIDINTIMVERSLALGLDARHDDLMTHLAGIEDAGRSALTAFHVAEHLPFGVLVDFLDETLRVLVPGGVMILETPNPETMRVGATTFYNDPTHRNPLMPEPLRFIVEHRGFTAVEILKLHPFTDGLLQEKTADADLLNGVLFGPQDYAIIARRA